MGVGSAFLLGLSADETAMAESLEARLRRFSMERSIQGVMEEGLEIAGTSLFLASFLQCLRFDRARHNPAENTSHLSAHP
jgi:hypothetical protein